MDRKLNHKFWLAIWVVFLAVGQTTYLEASNGPYASNPDPADGAEIYGELYPEDPPHTHIWTMLIFEPGATAVKHTGYFSDDYSKVYDRHQDANLGQPPSYIPEWDNIYFVGNPEVPPAVDSLVRGTTYYWCVDETDGNNVVWQGPIWSFYVQSYYATRPDPPNEAINIDTDVPLSWRPCYKADVYDVYIGTSFEPVLNANEFDITGIYQGGTTEPNWPCNGLPADTKIYWRVDAIHGRIFPGTGTIYKGDVWCFTTISGEAAPLEPADGAVIDGELYPEYPPHTHIWTMLVFEPGPTAVKHTGYFSEDYSKVYNRHQDANLGPPPFPYPGWRNIYFAGNPEVPPAIETLVRGKAYYWCVDEIDAQGNTFAGEVWEFTIKDFKAYFPNPPNEAVDVENTVLLSWQGGYDVDEHDVYLGTSWEDVYNAPRWDTTGIYQGRTSEPNWPCSGLPTDTKIYWRVDEVHDPWFEGPIYKGDVWCFSAIRVEATALEPADGEVIDGEPYPEPPAPQTHIWTMLIFDPGATAVKHTGYFSDDYSEVYYRHQDANLGEPPFSSPGWDNIYFVGNPEIEPAVDSLVGGTTYYWTVDETDAMDNTYPGDIWDFTVRSHSYYATNPDPPNEAKNINTDVLLCWESGLEVDFHVIYFSTSFDDVNNGQYEMYMPPPPWTQPGDDEDWDPVADGGLTIEFGTTYYWRVDEFDGGPLPGSGMIYKGDVWCFTTRPAVGLFFVDIDAVGANNGSSWADAFNHLQDALSIARPGDEIHVAEGTYKPDLGAGITPGDRTTTFKLINGVTIEGGYAGYGEPDPDSRNIELNETILSGDIGFVGYKPDNSYHVVTGSGTDANTIFDGFKITGGNADGKTGPIKDGGGMYNSHGSPTVINCTFSGNFSITGGGICNRSGSSTLTNCIFSDNSAWEGGGMFNGQSDITLINCTFSGNSVGIVGGGMYDSHSNSTVVNCTFSENSSRSHGGGMHGAFSEPKLTNCILWGNSSDRGSQIAMKHDSIVAVSFCNVQGGISGVYLYNSSIDWGEGNIDDDPCFVDASSGDLRLLMDSPCIDAGDNSAPNLPATDLDGHPRIIDGDCNDTEVVDMGAHEFSLRYLGDFDNDCNVDFVDFSIFGLAWMTKPGDAQWNRFCDISKPSDNYVDWRDAAVVCDNWLAELP